MTPRARLGEGGASAVEFAAMAPIVAVAGTAVFYGLTLQAGAAALEMGAAEATRWAALGLSDGTDRAAGIRRIVTRHVCPASLGEGRGCYWSKTALSAGPDGVVSPLRITARAYADPRNIGEPEPFSDVDPANGARDPGEEFVDVNANGVWDADMGASGVGGSGDFVVYEIEMAQDVGHPALARALGARIRRSVRVVARNEPW